MGVASSLANMGKGDPPNPLISLAAGGVSGAVSKTITAPLEKVKLAIQNQDSNPRVLSGEMKRYTGMGDCFMRHISELGATSLWRGNVANCIRYVPTAACNLMFKDTIKGLFPKVNKDKEFGKFAAVQIASGSAAGGLTNTIVYPLIYVRTVLGADLGKVKKYNGMADCLKKTVAQNAVSFSGVVSSPFDTMQRRLQIEASKPPEQQMYTGMPDCFAKILKTEGPGGFFKGALANV